MPTKLGGMEINMDQNNNTSSNMVSLMDLWTLFVSKLKLLVIVGLLVALVSGVLGAVLSLFGNSYEAVVKFYVSPNDSSDTLLYNMQSEMYAEELLLDKNGLPPKKECENKADYDAAVAAINAYEAKREEKRLKKLELEDFNALANQKPYEENYLRSQEDYERAYLRWSIFKSPQTDALIDESYFAELAKYEAELNAAKEDLEIAYAEYSEYIADKTRLQGELDKLSLELNRLVDERNKAVDKVLAPWRQTSDVKEDIALIMSSTTFEYTVLEVPENETSPSSKEGVEEIRNKGYITITVSVPENKEFATMLVEKIKTNTIGFIEQHIEEKTGTTRVDCRLISPYSSVCEKNSVDMFSGVVKLVIISVALTEIVLYGVLVIVMCAKKKRSAK